MAKRQPDPLVAHFLLEQRIARRAGDAARAAEMGALAKEARECVVKEPRARKANSLGRKEWIAAQAAQAAGTATRPAAAPRPAAPRSWLPD